MAGTTTTELDCLLSKCLARTGVHALGVFAADKVPYNMMRLDHSTVAVAFIVNSDVSTKPGEHWVAFLLHPLRRNNKTSIRCEFFDSYGISLFDSSSTYAAIKRYLPKWITPQNTLCNNVCLQYLDSASCGHYCILFHSSRAHGISFHRFVNSLSKVKGGAIARDKHVEAAVAKLRRLIPCIPERCDDSNSQCCVPQLCYRNRHS